MSRGDARWADALLDGFDDAIVVVDSQGLIAYANASACAIIGEEPQPELARELTDAINAVRSGTEPRARIELPGDGDLIWRGRAWPLGQGAVAVSLRPVVTNTGSLDRVRRKLGLGLNDARLAVYATQGMTNRDIAELYQVPIGTVATRLWRLYKRLGVRNRAELASAVTTATNRRPDTVPPPM